MGRLKTQKRRSQYDSEYEKLIGQNVDVLLKDGRRFQGELIHKRANYGLSYKVGDVLNEITFGKRQVNKLEIVDGASIDCISHQITVPEYLDENCDKPDKKDRQKIVAKDGTYSIIIEKGIAEPYRNICRVMNANCTTFLEHLLTKSLEEAEEKEDKVEFILNYQRQLSNNPNWKECKESKYMFYRETETKDGSLSATIGNKVATRLTSYCERRELNRKEYVLDCIKKCIWENQLLNLDSKTVEELDEIIQEL